MAFQIQAGNYRKMGVQMSGGEVTFTFQCPKETECAVLLYDKRAKDRRIRIEVPKSFCVGSVRSVTVSPLRTEHYYYAYEIDGIISRDPYGERVIGREKWADFTRDLKTEQLLSGFVKTGFDWGEDECPEVPAEQMVMYKLHIRGFSMDAKGRRKGTFAAVQERIPYLKELGITTVEVMPVYEFEEIMEDEKNTEETAGEKKINYWGYAPSDYFSVKSSYAHGKEADVEYKSLIKEMHEQGLELVMEIHFAPEQGAGSMVEILRYWVMEYHVDGFKLLGASLPIEEIVKDPYLSRTKLFYEGFPKAMWEGEEHQNLFVYNEDFLYPMRRMLNHLGGDMVEFTEQIRHCQPGLHSVNYIANNNTFTLADIFSYNEKHNVANGEENLDGNDWNYSTNYGVEGPSRRKFIRNIREKQMRNAMAVLCLAKGIPLILSGDEIGNSQNGNNNAYCQDNKIGWVNWRNEQHFGEHREFLRKLLQFRREHPILTKEEPFRMTDYWRIGYPDLSYHGEEAWIGGVSGSLRSVGVMYCEAYAGEKDGKEEETFLYIGYNFYMGVQALALPKLPKGKQWFQIMDTGETQPFLEEPRLLKKNSYEAYGQTVSILIGR